MLLASLQMAHDTLRQLLTKLDHMRARFARKQRQEEVAAEQARCQELLALRARLIVRHRLDSRDF